MPRYVRGSQLIETLIATALIVVGMFAVYLGLLESNRINLRNDLTSVGLNVLATEIDTDSKKSFNDPDFDIIDNPQCNTPCKTKSIPELPQGTLTRTINRDTSLSPSPPPGDATGIKRITYRLQWTGTAGNQLLLANTEIINQGLTNE